MLEPLVISLRRRWFTERSTIGELTCGAWSCFTLEDPVREGPKIPGNTAIPAGQYRVRKTMSPRFNRRLPLLDDVPQFTGIRIHPGNSAADTQGCILVGKSRSADWIGQSRAAFDSLFSRIDQAERAGRKVWITITNVREEAS